MSVTVSRSDRPMAAFVTAVPGAWVANAVDLGTVHPLWLNLARKATGMTWLPYDFGRMPFDAALGFDRWLGVLLAAAVSTAISTTQVRKSGLALGAALTLIAVGGPYALYALPHSRADLTWTALGWLFALLATAMWITLTVGGACLGRRIVEKLA